MSATKFKDDLLATPSYEESIASSNAGMNVALVLTLVLSVAFVIWAFLIGHNHEGRIQSPAEQYSGQLSAPAGSSTTHTTRVNGQAVRSDDDKSFVDGQMVNGTAPSNGIR